MKKIETIDMERLALAIADHKKTVAEVVAHKTELVLSLIHISEPTRPY